MSIYSKVLWGCQLLDIGLCDPGHAQLGGRFMVPTQEG